MHNQSKTQSARTVLIGAIALLFTNTIVWADGFRNPPPTATGIAKGNAHTVFVEDASATYYNPANLALLTTNEVQFSTTLAHSKLSWASEGIGANNEWAYLPNAFAAIPIGNSGFVFGLSITSPYGQGTEWDALELSSAASVQSVIYDAEMKMINISPALAMPVNETLLIGAGLDIAHSELTLTQSIIPLFNTYGVGDIKGTGIGAHAGITWFTTENQRFAFTYRSPTYIKYKGDFSVKNDSYGIFNGLADGDLESSIKFPTTITAGYGIEIYDSLKLEAQVEWVEWSLYQNATFDHDAIIAIANATIDQNWEDTWTFGLGGSYTLNDTWTLHFGYAFLESPIPDESYSPSFPDSDRHVISTGIGYQQNAHSLDLSYAYSIFKDRNIDSSENEVYAGTYKIDADLVGITYTYAF